MTRTTKITKPVFVVFVVFVVRDLCGSIARMALLEQAPRVTVEAASGIVRELYGLVASASPLPSERDQNFLIAAGDERFVLKVANATEDRAMLEAQNAAMAHLADRTTLCPRVVRTQSGEEIAVLPSRWTKIGAHLVRLV